MHYQLLKIKCNKKEKMEKKTLQKRKWKMRKIEKKKSAERSVN